MNATTVVRNNDKVVVEDQVWPAKLPIYVCHIFQRNLGWILGAGKYFEELPGN